MAVNDACRLPKTHTARTTPMIVPLPPKIDMPPKSAIATTLSSSPNPVSDAELDCWNV